MSSPLEEERNELGYNVVEVREGRQLRVVHRPCEASDVCLFFVHGGGGRAGQFKHLIKAFESTYVLNIRTQAYSYTYKHKYVNDRRRKLSYLILIILYCQDSPKIQEQ